MITYYRFLRFFPDGTCLSSLSNNPPADIVPLLHKPTVEQREASPNQPRNHTSDLVFPGKWSMTLDGHIKVEAKSSVSRYNFRLSLQNKSTSKGSRHNKLIWVSFRSVNVLTDDIVDIPMRSEKSYVFSPVRSFAREIYK